MAESNLINALMRPFLRQKPAAPFSVPGALGAGSRVLCIDTGDLADMVFHAPLLTAFKRRHPDAEIDFLVPEDHVDLVARSGLARHCIVYRDSQLSPWKPAYGSLLRKLGAGGYDVAMVMSFQPNPRLELAALASGASLRLGPSHEGGWPSVNFEVRPPSDGGGYYGDRMRVIAPFLGFRTGELKPRWPLPADRVRHMAQQVHFHKPNPDQMLVGIDPGATRGGFALAQENLHFLVRQLSSQTVCKVVALGLPQQRERIDRFAARLTEAPSGLPRESLLDVLVLASQCNLFIGANTELLHFAVAMGVPTIALFSDHEDPACRPAGCERVRILDVTDSEKVDIETLMEAVEAVTGGRVAHASTVIEAAAEAAPDEAAAGPAPAADAPGPARSDD